MSATRLERALALWLDKKISEIGADILGGAVKPDTYEIRKAERRAYMAMKEKLPDLAKQVNEG
jgi:hypothetical protein